jgi:hypothetical protein
MAIAIVAVPVAIALAGSHEIVVHDLSLSLRKAPAQHRLLAVAFGAVTQTQ